MSGKIAIVGACAIGAAALWLWVRPQPHPPRPQDSIPAQVAIPAAAPTADALPQDLQAIVARYRKTIVLLEDEGATSEDQERASITGKIIFQENHQALSVLSDALTAEIGQAGRLAAPPRVETFLDLLETSGELHDADKLVFRDVLADLTEALAGSNSTADATRHLAQRLEADRKALEEIQSLYEKELDAIFGRFDTRGLIIHREAWERYVAYLRTKYKRGDILESYRAAVGRIAATTKAGHKDNDLEIYGNGLPARTFVLTFDDGPHPRYTERILEILKRYHVKAVFFELGSNVGTIKKNEIQPTRAASAARHLVEDGFVIGSHGLTHAQLPKLSDREVAVEIDETNRLLESVTHAQPALFRPPYGDRDPKVLSAVGAHSMKSILWNIDSRDWADPVAKSIANRVVAEARKLNRGIILMHDIQARTIDALPLVLETLQHDGYRFLTWDGRSFIDDAPPPAAIAAGNPVLYHDSWAVIIGIDEYKKWPTLHYAVNDATGIREILLRKFRFKPDHVVTLLDGDATREKILSALGDRLSNPRNVQHDDRVFVFFAGHGTTRKLPSGRDLGYIVPVDADMENFQGQSISMTNFQDISESIPAKHVLFVMDSCYSGLALTRGQGSNANYLREMSRRTAREMLTAGGADEEVADNGPNGHSVFTWTVLQGLEGRADLNGDGFISAAELAAYVGPGVSALSHQTPSFGNLPGGEGGEFLFELNPETEVLSQLSAQLDQEAIQLNAELDRIRKEVADKSARNQRLRDEVAQARSQQAGGPTVPAASVAAAKAPDTASRHLNDGNIQYRERHYQASLDEFLTAARLEPANALAANNVGFLYFKLERFDDALSWYEKTVALDPRRAVAYANLGDLYYQLNRLDEARRAYQKYLELAPNSSYAPTARARAQQ